MSVVTRLFGEHAGVVGDREFRLLLLASVMAPLGTGLLSPILDPLVGVYGVSPARIGLVMSALTAPGVVVIPLAGALADRYGRKPVLVASLLVFGVAGGALSTTADFRAVLALRVVQGVGFSGIVPALIASIGDLYDGAVEATAQGMRILSVGVSLVVVPTAAGMLVGVDWRLPFLAYLAAVPIALAVAHWLREPAPGGDPGDADRQRADGGTDRETPPGDATAAGRSEGLRGLVGAATRPAVGAVLVARSLPTFVWVAFLTYNSIVVVQLLGGTPGVAGAFVALGSVSFAGAASQAGRLTDAFGGRFVPLVASQGALLAGTAAFVLAPSLPLAAVGVAVGGIGFGLGVTLYRSAITALAPGHLRGGLVSIGEALARLAATLAPVVLGAAIGAATPAVGFDGAVRGTLLGAVGACSLLGIAAVVGVRTSRRGSLGGA